MNIKDQILSATNFGLDVIQAYYPFITDAMARGNKKFKLREGEKTASSSIKLFDNCYWIKDFGSGKSMSCFDVVMEANRCEFPEALYIIARDFNVQGVATESKQAEPEKEYRDATPEEKEGDTSYIVKENFSNNDLRELFSTKVCERHAEDMTKLEKVCDYFNLHSLVSYTRIKNRKAITIKSTDQYPIYLYENDTFKKIYQPKAAEKQYRFFYIGQKPADFIFGKKQLDKAYAQHQNTLASDNSEEVDGVNPEKRDPKLMHAFLCSGERDALNVYALSPENHVLCLNSESAILEEKAYKSIMEKVNSFYNIPDIDATGITQGHKFAMEHLDVKTIWLPESLALARDFRGNKCKDVRDYLNRYKIDTFFTLIKTALPYRFWNIVKKYDKNGIFKFNEYVFNNLHAYNFLYRNGFSRFRSQNEDEGYIFIKVTGDVVKQVTASDIKDYINDFLKGINAETELRNMVYNTTKVKEQSLGNIEYKKIEFKDFTKESQFMFFENETWEITKAGVNTFKPGVVNKFTWDDEVIKYKVKILPDFFKVDYDPNSRQHSITILNDECTFFRYMINTANMHWRVTECGVKDIDEKGNEYDRKELTREESEENQLHLINRLYAFGYLLFRYKSPSKAWCVYAMENKIIEESASNGGSGKSIFLNALFYFMKSQRLNGRDKDLVQNKHWSEKITEHTDFVHLEDAHEYLDLEYFFNLITSDFPINPKHAQSYNLPFEDSPKMAISSNYPIKKPNQSTLRRILFTVFSDYYHHGGNEEFETSRSPKDDFGKELFRDYDEKEWNLVINLAAQCIRLALKFDKIEPPMQNVLQRNLIGEMGEAFLDWAEVFFSENSGKLNINIIKEHAFNDFTTTTKNKTWTSHKFKSSLKRFCVYKNYELNPMDLINTSKKDGRIIDNVYDDVFKRMKSHEMIHLRTKNWKELQDAAGGTIPKSKEEIPTDLYSHLHTGSDNDDKPF